jgi:hypothetical protein
VYWSGLMADLVVVSGRVTKVRLIDGFSGKTLRTFNINGNYDPADVLITLQNNELIICLYDPQTDRSRVTKV